MKNAGLEEAQARIKISGRSINNLRYADDTTLMAESEEERETGGGRGLSGLHWAWCIGRGPHLQLRQEPQGTSDFRRGLTLEMSPGREAACRAVFGTWGFFRTMHGKTAPSC